MAKAAEGKLAAEARARATVSNPPPLAGLEVVRANPTPVADLNQDDKSELEDIVGALARLGDPENVALPPTNDELADQIASDVSRDATGMARTAMKMLALKRLAGHSKWLGLLTERNVGERTAQRYLQLAEFLLALPESVRPRYLNVQVTKASELAKFGPDDLAEMSHNGHLDELLSLPKAELAKRVRQERQARIQAESQLEIAKEQHRSLSRAAGTLDAESELPMFARIPRQEVFAFGEVTDFQLDNLEMVLNEHLLTKVQHVEAYRFQPVVASNCHAALSKALARLTALRNRIEEHFPDAAAAAIHHDHQITAQEAKLIAHRVQSMKHVLTAAAKQRDDDRENSVIGKRGRKRHGGSR